MSYKIRQVPDLLLSEHFVSRFNPFNVPTSVKDRITGFILHLSHFREIYVEGLMEMGELIHVESDFYIFISHHDSGYYLLLTKANKIVSLFHKETLELLEEDWQEVKWVLMQEGWE